MTTRCVRAAARQTCRAALLACALAVALPAGLDAQNTSYSTGQSISPAFEGWEMNADGTFTLVFGYFNRNWDQAIDIPIGPDNHFAPGPEDAGQPTHLLPRRNLFVFRVQVPKDFGDSELVWTLTANGQTERAYGTLKPAYFIDNNVITANNGAAGGAGTNLSFQNLNKPPRLTLDGPTTRTARVGQPMVLAAAARDDNLPRPRNMPLVNPLSAMGAAVSSATGLRVAWFVYRGPAALTFDPPQFKVHMDTRGGSPWSPGWQTPPLPADGIWVVRATFDEPGTYVLRCLAHDGALSTFEDVTVTVTE